MEWYEKLTQGSTFSASYKTPGKESVEILAEVQWIGNDEDSRGVEVPSVLVVRKDTRARGLVTLIRTDRVYPESVKIEPAKANWEPIDGLVQGEWFVVPGMSPMHMKAERVRKAIDEAHLPDGSKRIVYGNQPKRKPRQPKPAPTPSSTTPIP